MTAALIALRESVFEKRGFRCYYCGSDDKLSIDHVIPVATGGKDNINNLVPACQPCNSTKGDRSLEEAKPYLVLRMLGGPLTVHHLSWLRANKVDMSLFDNAKLWFEQQGLTILYEKCESYDCDELDDEEATEIWVPREPKTD